MSRHRLVLMLRSRLGSARLENVHLNNVYCLFLNSSEHGYFHKRKETFQTLQKCFKLKQVTPQATGLENRVIPTTTGRMTSEPNAWILPHVHAEVNQ